MHFLGSKCNLLDENGEVAGEEMDQKVEFYFNLMLEPDEDQRNDENQDIQQISLKSKLRLNSILSENLKEGNFSPGC